jgi:hypothetical protein
MDGKELIFVVIPNPLTGPDGHISLFKGVQH